MRAPTACGGVLLAGLPPLPPPPPPPRLSGECPFVLAPAPLNRGHAPNTRKALQLHQVPRVAGGQRRPALPSIWCVRGGCHTTEPERNGSRKRPRPSTARFPLAARLAQVAITSHHAPGLSTCWTGEGRQWLCFRPNTAVPGSPLLGKQRAAQRCDPICPPDPLDSSSRAIRQLPQDPAGRKDLPGKWPVQCSGRAILFRRARGPSADGLQGKPVSQNDKG